MQKLLSTVQVAKQLGVMQASLQRAIAERRVPAPRLTTVGGITVRLWTQRDVERARKVMVKSGKWQLSRKRRTKRKAKRKSQ
jgi:hypothetical protein